MESENTSKASEYLDWRGKYNDRKMHDKNKDFVAQNISRVINQESSNEPVCLTISVVAEDGKIEELFKEMGIKTANKHNEESADPSVWLVSEHTKTEDGKRKVEIISPFMSQNKAMEEIPALMDCMETNDAQLNHNISRVLSAKMVIPSHDTMSLEEIKATVGTNEQGEPDFSGLIEEAQKNSVNEDGITQDFSNKETISYTYSGAVGSDAFTSPTPREGMYGGKYSSPDLHTACSYASNFLHVYRPSSLEFYGNFGIESGRAPLIMPDKDGNFPEKGKFHQPAYNEVSKRAMVNSMYGGVNDGQASVLPIAEQEVKREDMCVATYFHVDPMKGRFYKIPENDIRWKAFKDYHKLDISNNTENSFAKRHLNLQSQQKNGNTVSTYDEQWKITPVILKDKTQENAASIEKASILPPEINTSKPQANIPENKMVEIGDEKISLPNNEKGLKVLVALKRGISKVTKKYLKKETNAPAHTVENSATLSNILTNQKSIEK